MPDLTAVDWIRRVRDRSRAIPDWKMQGLLLEEREAIEALRGPRQTWASAGGADPSFGALSAEVVGGGVALPIDLGTSPYQTSRFGQIGMECFAPFRIEFGASPTAGTGFWTLAGLPVAPRFDGVAGHGGQKIGDGWWMHNTTKVQTYMQLVVDDGALGAGVFFFPVFKVNVGSAKLEPVDFAFGGNEQICHDSVPFAPIAGDILNFTLQYEGAG